MDWVVPVGSEEARAIAEQVQKNEAAEHVKESGDMPVTDAEANTAIAEIHAGIMSVIAMSRGDHWAADEEEKKDVRDLVAPSVKEAIPNRVLANSKHVTALLAYARIVGAKAKEDRT